MSHRIYPTYWRGCRLALLLVAVFGCRAARANKVTIRDDRTFLIDAQPFFPVGLYYPEEELADETGALLKDLRSTGFNTVFFIDNSADPLGPKTRATLDRVAAAGLHTQWRPPGQLSWSFDVLKKTVTAYKDHPAMLFWEHGDEPMVNGGKFEEYLLGYKLMKELDPDHPVLMVEYPFWTDEARLKEFATACDVYAFDKYPIPLKRWFYQGADIPNGWPHSIAIMGELTAWWQTLAPGKPTLTVLQAWNRKPQEDGKAGYPTTRQSLFMAYQSVIRGAKGLLYYGKIRVTRPAPAVSIPPEVNADPKIAERDLRQAIELNDWFWADFNKVIKEVGGMTAVFAARDAGWTPQIQLADSPGVRLSDIQCRVKETDTGPVLLLVNASDHLARITVAAPKLGPTVHLWREARQLQEDAEGSFPDTLDPYAVRVYATKAGPAN